MESLITTNFPLAEFCHSQEAARMGITNTLPQEYEANALALCTEAEKIRSYLGSKPMSISSGYRCPAVNAIVSGVINSAHLYGCAMDFNAYSFGGPLSVAMAIQHGINTGNLEVQFDQIIHEFGQWVHFAIHPQGSIYNRREYLTIDRFGTRVGLLPVRTQLA